MATNASTILTLALQDIGVLAEGEVMSAPTGSNGLARLNAMVSGWQAQYGTVTAIERYVFPLTANKQTYTIGLGGDFNVPRPLFVSGAGLYLNGLASALPVVGITRVVNTATVEQTAHPFAVGDEVLIDGAVQIGYNGVQTINTVPDADHYTFTAEGEPTTPATGTITAAAINGQPIEIPRPVITDNAYQSIQLKNMPNSLFTNVYFNATYPFATIYLWPRPNTSANQLVLYLANVFSGFATLTRNYDYPSLPGYGEALEYQVAKRLWPSYHGAAPFPDHLERLARQTFGIIKRANNKLVDVATDASLLTWNPRGWFNINTGTGGYGGNS